MGKRTLTAADELAILTASQQGRSHTDIARGLGVNQSTVSRAIERARATAGSGAKLSPSLSDGKDRDGTGREKEVTDAGASGVDDRPGASAPGIQTLAWGLIDRSPLNPRRHFDPTALAFLAENIFEVDGIKQSLLVRPRADSPGRFWLIDGERRHRAAGLLVEQGRWPADHPVPVLIEEECDDIRHLMLALSANLQRADMNAMEEAEGYTALMDQGITAADIARQVLGRPAQARFVQLRVNLTQRLCEEGKDALRRGAISAEQAKALTLASAETQPNHLREVLKGSVMYRTTDDIRRQIRAGLIPVADFARFRPLYAGPLVTDDQGVEYFADAAEISRLRREEIAETLARLASEGHGTVKQFGWGQARAYPSWEWTHQPDHPLAVTIVDVPHSGDPIQILPGMVEKSKLAKLEAGAALVQDPATGAAAVTADPFTKGHLAHARRRKSAALQAAVAHDPLMAKRLVVLALLGGTSAVDLGPIGRRGPEDFALAEPVARIIREAGTNWGIGKDAGGFTIDAATGRVTTGPATTGPVAAAKLFGRLLQYPEPDLDRLFAALVALQVGSFTGYGEPMAGDDHIAQGIAGQLGLVDHPEQYGLAMAPEDLDGIRKPALVALARQSGLAMAANDGRGIQSMPARDLAAAMVKAAADGKAPPFVVPTLRFADPGAIAASMAAAMTAGDPPPAAPPAKATPPAGEAEAMMSSLRAVLSLHSILACSAEPTDRLSDVVGQEDLKGLATDLSAAFEIAPPLLVAELQTAETLADLITLLAARRAAAGKPKGLRPRAA
ncbi:MAG: ParB N-terminal domain-containing protein [Alphaproteobacteria bacterium]|nr:ParB N-terminal domain-containing protein [Alphaproteobacteria bacterium]